MADPIPDATLDALARGFYSQGQDYGFTFDDYVRFVNRLLDVAMTRQGGEAGPEIAGGLPLVGERVTIRATEPGDRVHLRRWLSDPSGRFFLLSRGTGQVQELDELLDDDDNHIGIITLRDGRPVGAIAYLVRDPEQRRAELRKVIGEPELRGQGLGTEAARLWVAHGLRNLHLQKIFLYTLTTNTRNLHLNEQLGFRTEGLLRDEVVVDGESRDVVRMGLVHQP
jgi:RimJ/RimL family protein N-acetyltransferase